MRTNEEINKSIENHIQKIVMWSRILQVYKMPYLSLKEIVEIEAKILAEYED